MSKTVGFIGSVGIPNCYGGFEAFLEAVAPEIVKNGFTVYVTCYSGVYTECSEDYLGVKRVFINIKANGVLSPIHDFIAFLKIFRRVNTIVVLGVSAGPFFLLMKLITYIFNKRLIVNVDGVEWRRNKYNFLGKKILLMFDRFAQWFADIVVYDNAGLFDFLTRSAKKRSACISYSGDYVSEYMSQTLVVERSTALTVCRVEPENNLDLMIEAVLFSNLKRYTVVGNFKNSSYGMGLLKKYKFSEKVKLLDPIYDKVELNKLRQSSHIYLHGHSVGGTNPSLVEMLFYNVYIVCFDCNFNRYTCGDYALYFKDSKDLASLINKIHLFDDNEYSSKSLELLEKYSTKNIALEYIKLLKV